MVVFANWDLAQMLQTRPEVTVASGSLPKDKRTARVAIVEQHIRLENEHDLESLLRTFGDSARYDDEPWGEHYTGRNGVCRFYQQLMKALPDLEIEVQQRHVTDDAILVEVVIRGTHLGGWRSLPPTVYYDRGTVLRQLGVFHEPQSILGQISILATHPATIARAYA